jgi:aspartate ammonia-lyase
MKHSTDIRTEHDGLGERPLLVDALHGIHTDRAIENFRLVGRPVRAELIHAYAAVKLACARTNHELGWWDGPTFGAIERACGEMQRGELDESIQVDALQGGAGTSTNMNVNEVLANRTLQLLQKPLGDYQTVSPLDDINLHQSTNDTYPTAFKIAAIGMLHALDDEVNALVEAFQHKEHEFADVVKVGRTQMQDAVLTTLGRQMSAYAEAFGRDRWRIYKCEERLRVVNLGGTAIGTGLGAPREYIFRVIEHLRDITGLGLARAENLVEATQNADVFVEVSGILKALASSLLKVSSDLRLLSSGPETGFGEVSLPPKQAGSSIMPGKVNPVIPEAVSQAAMVVIGHDATLTTACSMGSLELNPFLPVVAEMLLESLQLLTSACRMLREKCIDGLQANAERCRQHVDTATATVTALVDELGYETALEVITHAKDAGTSIRQAAIDTGRLSAEQFDNLVTPERVTRLGYPLKERRP